jgi:hypothetical protein
MERVAGSDWRKGSFTADPLIGPTKVQNKIEQKFIALQNIFPLLL